MERSLPRDQALKLMTSDGRLLSDSETLRDHGFVEGPANLIAILSQVTLAELKVAGSSATDLKHRGYTFRELLVFDGRELLRAGITPQNASDTYRGARIFKRDGVTSEELRR